MTQRRLTSCSIDVTQRVRLGCVSVCVSAHTTCSCCAGVFAYAGTKDKRAVTVQQVTAFKVADGRLAALNSRLWYASASFLTPQTSTLNLACLLAPDAPLQPGPDVCKGFKHYTRLRHWIEQITRCNTSVLPQ